MAKHAQWKRDKEGKAQEEAERKTKQAEKEEEEWRQRIAVASNPNIEFTGALKSKKKGDLRTIAHALGLELLSGTNEELISAIQTCLLSNPSYRTAYRYTKLYPSIDRANAATAPTTSASHTARDNSHTQPGPSSASLEPPRSCNTPTCISGPSVLLADDLENIPPVASDSGSQTPGGVGVSSMLPTSGSDAHPPLVPIYSYPQHTWLRSDIPHTTSMLAPYNGLNYPLHTNYYL